MSETRLMPHQIKAVGKLRSGSILCGGVGTGKSLTALGYFYKVCGGVEWTDGVLRGPVESPLPLYIITTARKRDTKEWEAECNKVCLGEGPVTVDSWNNIEKYRHVGGAFFIFDEQRVVGRGAWAKAFRRIAKQNHWILLSATPGDNWMDYMQVFVANGFYASQREYLDRHAVFQPFSKYPKVMKWIETERLESLRRRITVTMEVEKKTTPIWNDILVEYDEERYKIVMQKRWDPWDNEPIQNISKACYLLRKAASRIDIPVQINNRMVLVDRRSLEIFWIEQKKHSKVIVFYNYDYELEALKSTLQTMRDSISCEKPFDIAEWNGYHHEPLPKGKRWFYIVQYTAGCEGWNCIETDTVIFYSQSYSYKQMHQAAGRVDRMNTPFEELHYYVFKSKAPIDIAVSKALNGKKKFNEKLFADKLFGDTFEKEVSNMC